MNPIHQLKTMSHDERMSILEGDAYSVEQREYYKPLTSEELTLVKDELTAASVNKAFLDDELDTIKSTFKSKTDPLKLKISEAIVALKTNAKTIQGKVYNMADQTEKMMYQVDGEGNVLGSRMLKPEERQMVIGRGISSFTSETNFTSNTKEAI